MAGAVLLHFNMHINHLEALLEVYVLAQLSERAGGSTFLVSSQINPRLSMANSKVIFYSVFYPRQKETAARVSSAYLLMLSYKCRSSSHT